MEQFQNVLAEILAKSDDFPSVQLVLEEKTTCRLVLLGWQCEKATLMISLLEPLDPEHVLKLEEALDEAGEKLKDYLQVTRCRGHFLEKKTMQWHLNFLKPVNNPGNSKQS